MVILPNINDIFNAFHYTPIEKIKVVIIGQDPYHEINQAHGFSFSVPIGTAIPPSLNNIYKELKNDIVTFEHPNHGCLINWAYEGVLLLNSILTVEKHHPLSHKNFGWEIFTNKIIVYINKYCKNVVFLLWGLHAQTKQQFIDQKKHFILTASHPSPLSAYKGFFGCKHFSRTNNILIKHGIQPINWNVLKS
uniref:Uracil-DNA glycosylase n=1 Tax=Candidatus Aschnera chinzeii TaxID=1485666 RepID=A0AAT9G3V0_9ENTR|nr:MAG: uracil-DNA glycosylase [Candidatus Aschnera chinzeii]